MLSAMSDMAARLNTALEGRYAIERELGEGGMATVYLADDLKHNRKVALKVLKPELAAIVGAERFLAEIQVTANLQHPNILPLFDSGEADSFLFYVMPYVEGDTLKDRLAREGQLPVNDAVAIAKDMAEALQAAHEQGVIHRDIKPGNVLISRGKPLISDFGIALALSASGAGERLTETGLSLGTPYYMSPEQATGDQAVGASTDTYALGCVLYEMLVGDPPFAGSTAQAVLGKIIAGKRVSATEERPSVPANVDGAIRKALEKLAADRFASAQEFAKALGDEHFRYGEIGEAGVAASGAPWKRISTVFASLFVLTSAIAAWGWLGPASQLPSADSVRFTIVPPESAPLDFVGDYPDLAISRDGRQIVYRGPNSEGTGQQLNLRPLGELSGAPLRGAEDGFNPVISPDGKWVAFIPGDSPSTLQRVSILGGAPVPLAEAPSPIRGVSWGAEDQIVFGTTDDGLLRVFADRGEPEALTTLGGDEAHIWPSIIDGRGAVVFVITTRGIPALTLGRLAVVDLDSREVTRLGIQGVSPRYVSTGHLIYAVADGSLRAVPFDAKSLTVTGGTVPLVEGVSVKRRGAANFDISDDGHLVYASGGAGSGLQRSLVWIDREDGGEEPIAARPGPYAYPRLSPDGSRVALDSRSEENDILIWDLRGGTLNLLDLGEGLQTYPVWTANGERVAYGTASSIYWKAANNTGSPAELADTSMIQGVEDPSPYFFALDETALVFRDQNNRETGDDLKMISIETGTVIWRLDGDYHERNAELSTDGRWMAYQSNESGEFQIYVRPFPQVLEDQVPVSNNGGLFPLWSRDGSELFYLQPGAATFQLISVSFDTDPTFEVRNRQVVLEDWPYSASAEGRSYDVSDDGRRFLVLKLLEGIGEGARPEITVHLNWFTTLRQQMGGN